jgi:surface protein
MFANCYAMKCIDIDNWLTPKLRYMDGVFSGNKGLITVKASNLNTSNVTDMAGLFYKCPELKEVIGIENWVCSKAKYLQYAFEGCISLVSLDLSGWNVKEVVNMDKMFAGCTSLEEVNLAGWNTTHFKGSGTEWGAAYLFANCKNLKKVNLSGWALPENLTVQNVSGMFSNCNSLTRENVITDDCSEHTINLIDEYFNQ